MSLAAFLLAIAASLVGRVLFALGFSVVTVVGVEAAIGQMKFFFMQAVMSLPGDILSLFLLSGGGVAMNAILGAITFRLSYWGITKTTRILGAG